MEAEAEYNAQGAGFGSKYVGILRAYNGELIFWGIRKKAIGNNNYINLKITGADVKKVEISNPNNVRVTGKQKKFGNFKVQPGLLSKSDLTELASKMPYTPTPTTAVSESELSKKLDRAAYFLSQNPQMSAVVVRDDGAERSKAITTLLALGVGLIVAIITFGFVAAFWFTLTKL